jgi:hypothetical protein
MKQTDGRMDATQVPRATWRLLFAPARAGSGAQKVQGVWGGLFVVCTAYFYNRESHSFLCVGMLPYTCLKWLITPPDTLQADRDKQLRLALLLLRAVAPGSNPVLVIG